MMKIFAIIFAALMLNSEIKNTVPDAKAGDYFGTEFVYQDEQIVSFKQAKKLLKKQEQVHGIFVFDITEVCAKKGCWLNVQLDKKTEGFVKMQDYAFFLPMNTSGKKIALDGYMYLEEISVKELQHYAEDAGKSEAEIAKITKPEKRYRFMASGIKVLE